MTMTAPRKVADDVLAGVHVIDTDTHLAEPHDFFTRHAPVAYRDRVPRVATVDGWLHWVCDGVVLSRVSTGGAVILADGSKTRGTAFMSFTPDQVHRGAMEVGPRLALMDELGIFAQILYPTLAGFGSQRFAQVQDPELRRLCAVLYNDSARDYQAESGERLFPMALVPWWDIAASAAEVRRAASIGLKGVVMCSEPQTRGVPDLGQPDWDPFWEACSDTAMSVNFHIGSSDENHVWFGSSPWPSQPDDHKLAIGSAMMYLTNARTIANLIYSGVCERFPKVKFVSVESGIGWIPFFLEALDHQLYETAPGAEERLSLKPSEYFRRQMYGCFWFEKRGLRETFERVGADSVMFETDYPHPTCLYPDSTEVAARALVDVPRDVVRKVMQDNAARLYHIDLPA